MEAARRAAHRPTQLTHEYSLFAPGDATSPRVCRDFVRAVLFTHDLEPLVMPAALCTSELVTNVHLHTQGAAMLRVRLTPVRLRVSVFDESPAPPVAPPVASDAAADAAAGAVACWGRGLCLVTEVADAWGVAADRAGRFAKGVWFELGALTPVPPVRMADLSKAHGGP